MENIARKKRVLFLCTHNAARSQMAEEFLRELYGDIYDAHSAGTHPAAVVNPFVIQAMAEVGIDLAQKTPQGVRDLSQKRFNYVVTVCDTAKEACPFYFAEKIFHESFPDPSEFKGTDQAILENVRKVRDQIQQWIIKTFGE